MSLFSLNKHNTCIVIERKTMKTLTSECASTATGRAFCLKLFLCIDQSLRSMISSLVSHLSYLNGWILIKKKHSKRKKKIKKEEYKERYNGCKECVTESVCHYLLVNHGSWCWDLVPFNVKKKKKTKKTAIHWKHINVNVQWKKYFY